MCLVYTGGKYVRDLRFYNLPLLPLGPLRHLTFVVHIEFIGVRGILSSIGVPGTPDLQPELQRVYLCSFFLSCKSEEAAGLVWF